jgi:hypothetical protein
MAAPVAIALRPASSGKVGGDIGASGFGLATAVIHQQKHTWQRQGVFEFVRSV